MLYQKIAFLFVFPVLLCFIGCGPKTVHVSGVVTYDGKPAKDIRILFQGTGSGTHVPPPAIGVTDAEGKYELILAETRKKGVLPGTYTIYMSWADPHPDPNPVEGLSNDNPNPYKFPIKATNGEMSFTVTDSGTKDANFDLEPASGTQRSGI